MSSKELVRRKFLKQLAQAAVTVPSFAVSNALGQSIQASQNSSNMPFEAANPWFLQGDHPWARTMSKPKYDIEFEFNVKKIPMRDGIKLAANIWRPKAKGKFPTIYIHISYDKSNAAFAVARAKYFVPRGYVFIAVDCRGRYDSDGVPYFYWHTDWRNGGFEGQDVQDTLNWIGQQEWSSGKIGMTGPSYLGFVQWMGASLGSPYLSALIPYVTPDDHYDNVYPGGAFQLTNSMHCMAVIGADSRTNNNDLEPNFYDWNGLVRHLPLRTLDTAMLGRKAEVWQDFIDHPDNDHYWRFSVGDRPRTGEMGPGRYSQVNVPSLNITGWYDQVSQATINNYMGMVQYGPKQLRDKHQLIVGPWEHAVGLRKVGDLDFGPESNAESLPPELGWSAYWLRNVELRWYDYWLKGINNGIMDEAPVHVFAMGENKWLADRQWPSVKTSKVRFYIHSRGHANSRYGDGVLSQESPGQEPTDNFVYDPEEPVPTFGGIQLWQGFGIPNSDGPRDQRSIQNRNDVLVYTSDVLGERLHVNGRVMFNLYASTTTPDTDFTAKLVDLHPNGYAQILRDGILRGRYRESYKKQKLLTPGTVYEFEIDLWSISHVFQKGHRIQVEISSSNFPKYDRNPNTGSKFGEDAQLRKATQTIFHNAEYSSHLVLPVL